MAAEHPDSLSRLQEELAAAEREIERKDQIIAGLQQRLFGSKSERIDPNQHQLEFGEDVLGKPEALPPTPCGGEGAPEEDEERTGRRNEKRRSKNDLLPRNLPVIVEEVVVPAEVESDPGSYEEIGEEHHDELEVTRASLYWRRKTRKKFKRKDDRNAPPVLVAAPEPSVPGTKASVELLAMILADKYSDHLPHYRQSERFLRRFGAELSRQTINRWTHAAAAHLAPVNEAIKAELQKAGALQIDESPGNYLAPGTGKTGQGYLWYYRAVVEGTLYCEWQLGRGHQSMFGVLGLDRAKGSDPFTGTIQCDGYSAYRALIARYSGIQLGACLAHIRRKFHEAREQSPRVVMPILKLIAEIYRIEHWLRKSGPPSTCRMLVRRAKAREMVDELKKMILTERQKHLPRSKLGEAVGYALNQWEEFERYLEDGRLEIDNNLIENAIRPAKLGLKNYLFFGSAEAGASSALFYTLIGNCKAHGIDPERYFAIVLDRMTTKTTQEESAELTPAKLAPEIRAAQPVPAIVEAKREKSAA